MAKEILNAKIEGYFLGKEDHGIFTGFIYLDYGGSKQGYGGYDLRRNNALYDWMMHVMEAAGVDDMTKLVGKHIRVESEGHKIHRIGPILGNEWLVFPKS